eukprot:SAG25_NODE_866_length_5015_cov_1.822213_2_plen_88_part_00
MIKRRNGNTGVGGGGMARPLPPLPPQEEVAGLRQELLLAQGAQVSGFLLFLRVHWVAVPQAMRARRVNTQVKEAQRQRRMWELCVHY